MKKSILACSLLLAYSAINANDLAVVTTTPTVDTQTTSTTTPSSSGQAATTASQPTAENLNCNFHFPAIATVSENVVKMWSEKAILQAFDYNSDNLDAKLEALKTCFTDAGWVGFTSALDQSGNLASIRNQKLTVSAQIDGSASMSSPKENQWKLTLPLQVVYQNKQDKVTQLLTIELFVSRKISGDLGIQQIIASPRQEAPVVKN